MHSSVTSYLRARGTEGSHTQGCHISFMYIGAGARLETTVSIEVEANVFQGDFIKDAVTC